VWNRKVALPGQLMKTCGDVDPFCLAYAGWRQERSEKIIEATLGLEKLARVKTSQACCCVRIDPTGWRD
jgi:hypothetical protein